MKSDSLNLRAGEIVEVRSAEEIHATLDSHGALEGLIFNAEMQKYCGQQFTVQKPVKKITIEEEGVIRARNIKRTVLLERVECDGDSHGGCQRQCQVLWKEAWLKRGQGDFIVPRQSIDDDKSQNQVRFMSSEKTTYSCQTTSLLKASSMPFWDISQRFYDLSLSVKGTVFQKMFRFLYGLARQTAKTCFGFYGPKQSKILLGNQKRTPTDSLNLQRGDLVKVKTKEEVLATLDFRGRNRGLFFQQELLKYCGKKYRVLARVEKMLNEKTGEMIPLENTVILEDVTCDGAYHNNCQRNCYCLWREIWLVRLNKPIS